MYEECTDVYGEESSSDAVYIGGSSSGYYETDEKAVAVYGNVGDDEPAAAPSTTDVPEFLRQDRQQQQAIEAAKLRMFYMTYRQSALFTSLSHGFEQSVGTWNQRFQTLMDMDDSFAKYDKLRSMVTFFLFSFCADSSSPICDRHTTLCMLRKRMAVSSFRKCVSRTTRKPFAQLPLAELLEDKNSLCRTYCSSLRWTLRGCMAVTRLL